MKNKNGFVQDPSGIFHFQWRVRGTTVMDAAIAAITDHPGGPAWFWFNGYPAPIYLDDSPQKLVRRWGEYQKACAEPDGLRTLLEKLGSPKRK